MPFRNAPWALLALAPFIVFAFWPGYFGDLRHATMAFHAHGLTASAWLALVGLQGWTAHNGDRRLHRGLGRALFVVVPMFAGGAVLVMHSMATKFAAESQPFYAALGARLGLHDLVSTTVLVAMVCAALWLRRRMVLHGGFMLATVLLVLPPVVARLPLPRVFHSGEWIAIALAALVVWRVPKAWAPFALVIGVQIFQIILFETFGASDAWAAAFSAFSRQPVWPWALAAMIAASAALWLSWSATALVSGPRRPRQATAPVQ